MNNKNVPTKRNSKDWDQSNVSKILKNKIYIGDVFLHRTKKIDPQLDIVGNVPLGEQIAYFDKDFKIINRELFELVQEEKKRRFEIFGDFKCGFCIVWVRIVLGPI